LGAQHKIAVVRGELDFERAKKDGHEFNDLFIWAMGAHPSALMYHYVVESMIPFVETAVHESRKRQHADSEGRKEDGA